MGKENHFGTALTKELCRVCNKSFDGSIVMNTLLTAKNKEKVESLHGKVVGYKEEPCEDCKNYMEQGVVVIGIDVEKSGDDLTKDPYRSGHFSVVKDRVFEGNVEILEKRVCYMCHKEGILNGFFKEE